MQAERRLLAMEDARVNRQKAKEEQENNPDSDVLEEILRGLQKGDTRRSKKRRNPQDLDAGNTTISADDPSFMALDMLAQLQSDGFELAAPNPNPVPNRRSRRRRTDRAGENDRELPSSPLATEITDMGEFSTDSYYDNDSRS